MFANIVVGTDGSESAATAVAVAAEIARQHGAVLHVVNAYRGASSVAGALEMSAVIGAVGVVDLEVHPAALEEASRATLERATSHITDVEVTTHAIVGSPADVMTTLAAEVGADLIVVGSKGMRGARRVIGSVPNSVAHNAPCHVLVAKTA
jgi:nucleotide-binding universal stress UspA family protein